MKWQISGTNVALSPALLNNAERKVRTPLERFGPAVQGVELHFTDLKPGVAPSECEIHACIHLRGRGFLSVHQHARDFYAALDSLASRLRNAVVRRVGKFRASHHQLRLRETAALAGA